jgi:hypothetical protein
VKIKHDAQFTVHGIAVGTKALLMEPQARKTLRSSWASPSCLILNARVIILLIQSNHQPQTAA